jgi:hypothetical protein
MFRVMSIGNPDASPYGVLAGVDRIAQLLKVKIAESRRRAVPSNSMWSPNSAVDVAWNARLATFPGRGDGFDS